ncbi:hypothetical protein HDU99_005104 [Rhizoclosmatium hyalinum]|nr:hypothetical protein HDU99_005104 [Rhizoclosmatium hyalinum]
MLPSTSKPICRVALGPRCSEDGRVRKTRYTPSVGLKQVAIKEARETDNISQTAIQYGVGRSALQGWIKQEENLAKSIKSKRTLHNVTQHEVSGLPLTRRMIAIKVMAKYPFFCKTTELQTAKTLQSRMNRVRSYIEQIMKRNGLADRAGTHIAQNAVVDVAQVSDFVDLVKEWRRHYNVSWHRVINMDQTNVPFDIQAKRTITRRGIKTVNIKKPKTTHGSRATANLAVTATGCCLPAFVVFKGKKKRQSAP